MHFTIITQKNVNICLVYFQLNGNIDDCSCTVDTVDYFNNVKIYPRLQSLLVRDYFRFYKVNLKRDCPFWADDSKCAIRFCHVKPCQDVSSTIMQFKLIFDEIFLINYLIAPV